MSMLVPALRRDAMVLTEFDFARRLASGRGVDAGRFVSGFTADQTTVCGRARDLGLVCGRSASCVGGPANVEKSQAFS